MRSVGALLRQHEFHLFIFCLLFILIDWPFLDISARHGLIPTFKYLFGLWGLFIFLLFLVQRALNSSASDGIDDQGG